MYTFHYYEALPACVFLCADPCYVLPQRPTRVHPGTTALHDAASGFGSFGLQELQQDALLPHHWEQQHGAGYTHTHTHILTTSSLSDWEAVTLVSWKLLLNLLLLSQFFGTSCREKHKFMKVTGEPFHMLKKKTVLYVWLFCIKTVCFWAVMCINRC